MKKLAILFVLVIYLSAGCVAGRSEGPAEGTDLDVDRSAEAYEDASSPETGEDPDNSQSSANIAQGPMGMGYGRGMGTGRGAGMWPQMGAQMGAGMHARHHAQIPQGYAGLSNPLPYTEQTLALGEELYTTNCASCHGAGGFGDGPAGASLDPAPAVLAHSGMMMADDYLYWRIAEGGSEAPFNSAMPAWGSSLDEEQIWQLVTYLRGLSEGWMGPQGAGRGAMMGNGYSDQIHAEMLTAAIEGGLISEEQAEVFNTVHAALEGAMVGRGGRGRGLGMEAIQVELLEELVSGGKVTREQADTFLHVHELLEEAGLMGCGGC